LLQSDQQAVYRLFLDREIFQQLMTTPELSLTSKEKLLTSHNATRHMNKTITPQKRSDKSKRDKMLQISLKKNVIFVCFFLLRECRL